MSSFLHCVSSSIAEAWKEDKAHTSACEQESTSNDKEDGDDSDDENQDIILNNDDDDDEEEDSNENLLYNTTMPGCKSTSGTGKKSVATR